MGGRGRWALPAPPVESGLGSSGLLVVWGVLVSLSFFSPFATVEMACQGGAVESVKISELEYGDRRNLGAF